MVDFASLRDARFDDLKTASQAWQTYSKYLRGSAQVYATDVVGGIGKSGWKGVAAETAKREITPESERLKRASFTAFSIYNALAGAEQEFRRAQRDLRNAIAEAHSLHIRVGDDGSLTAPPLAAADRHDPESRKMWGETLRRLSGAMQTAVDDATKTDQRLAGALPKLFPERAWKEGLPTDLSDVPPLWPASDYGRPWGVESPTGRDEEVYRKVQLMALGGAAKGWPTASSLLSHWLDGSGSTKHVDVGEIMERSPEMQREIQRTLAQHPGPGKFDSGWKSANFDYRTNLDMYYAFNGYQYRVHGDGGNYTVEFYKRYNFGTAEEQRNPVTIPLAGTVTQPEISHLHTTGMARDYDVHGSSGFRR
ncbi:hypothetical protein [Actinomadura rubrisoli]|uniref:Uncharacterized protein n=1 Tax=Actinomadura rubrisoli TaxID=2530368 RepID=A0A4R5AZV7_9ACTN|nr:hypothetical protein [Actinomadura rubrisoli]TDD79168.1 hypothetical protein E1298_28390 [Actinomadura rubrisoli]